MAKASPLRPMLASLAEASLTDPQFLYEPKYDGIRAIVEVTPRGPVRLWSRAGNEKTAQFPEIARALTEWSARLEAPVVLDGEVVALDARGKPAGFQNLQGRIHRTSTSAPPDDVDVAFVAFDILRNGTADLRGRPLRERREILEDIFAAAPAIVAQRSKRAHRAPILRISDSVRGDGRELYKRALASGWEGLVAKRADSRYESGKRTPDWRKLKILHEQEFVIGGWTEPRQTRAHFGALLLGIYDSDHRLVYAGHTGTGFSDAELARLKALLTPLETHTCPFNQRPATNERPHWVRPTLVAEIKFTEWTAEGSLRHPVYLGLRDDKKAEDVVRETRTPLHAATTRRAPAASAPQAATDLVAQLHEIEDSKRDGTLTLPDRQRLNVGNLHKVFWPKQKLTKGDLFRYYASVAPFLLPAVADRPLVMKRFPNGTEGKPFYQHRAPDEAAAGVRVETPKVRDGVPQIVGGTLMALLYTTQLAAISQDPWLSRLQSVPFADHVALDLDPAEGVPFARVLDVARWIRDELDALGTIGVPKTSGADGLHIYIPLPPRTSYEAGQLFCQIIATVVAQKHPKTATVERQVRARGPRVYVDYLQNILGKTLATAYSARASAYAGVSTPLTWQEVADGVRREEFTIQTVPKRLASVGDLWAALRESKGIDLSRVLRYADGPGKGRRKKA